MKDIWEIIQSLVILILMVIGTVIVFGTYVIIFPVCFCFGLNPIIKFSIGRK